MRTTLKYLGGAILAAGLFWWVLSGTDTAEVWKQLREASIPLLLLAAFLNLAQNVPRVWRWRALLEPVRPAIPFRPMFSAVILGYLTSWTVPGRLGELVRPALLAGRERLPLSACLGSIVADRMLDALAVLVVFVGGTALIPLHGEAAEHVAMIRAGSLGLLAVIAVPLVALLIVSSARDAVERRLIRWAGLRERVGRAILGLSDGMSALRNPRLFLIVTFHTALTWSLIVAGTWLAVRASGASIEIAAMCVIMPLLVLGIALPTPGGAGGYHAAMTFGLTALFNVEQATAIGASFLAHLIIIVPVVVLGVALLFIDRIPFNDLLNAARQVRGSGPKGGPSILARSPVEKPL